jgi:hypothetical protein
MSGEGIWVPPGGSADPERERPARPEAPTEPTPEELIQEFQRIKVSDLLVSTVYTLSQIGYGKLDPQTRDIEQAKLAIDALRALLPVLQGSAEPDLVRDFNQVLANMQLAYADAIAASTPPGEEPKGAEEEPKGAEDEPQPAREQPAEEDLEAVDEEELGGGG